jgi:fatty acid desaturase
MKNLKKMSIINLVIYPIFFFIVIYTSIKSFLSQDGQDNYIPWLFICFALIIYAMFYIVMGFIKGYKYKKISLIITSMVGCVIFGIYFFTLLLINISYNRLLYNNMVKYTRQGIYIGYLFTLIPISIIFSIIILIISLKIIKKNN